MGYDLHITRRRDWADEGADISAAEWLDYVESDPELQLEPDGGGEHFARWDGPSEHDDPWFAWSDGQIYTKNPDPPIIDKMVAIAQQLGAVVQGDDGEIYESGSGPPSEPTLPLGTRIAAWLSRLVPRRHRSVPQEPLPFGVGDRVRDFLGEWTVVSIDPEAEHGLGIILLRRDDGFEQKRTVVGHNLERIENPPQT